MSGDSQEYNSSTKHNSIPPLRLSRSKRSPSRIYRQDDEKVSINPIEIDELITNYYETKLQLRELEAKEQRYKRLIHRLLDITQASQIKGRALEVSRRTQKRRHISKRDVPNDIWEQYSREMNVSMLFVKAL